MKSIVILISGRGSNMRSLVEASFQNCRMAVISNRPDAGGLNYARSRGLATAVVDHRQFSNRAVFDEALATAIDAHAPDLVILAGFMRILGEPFVQRYQGRLLNIHPSLLPAFPGMHTHEQALAAGVRLHGCTVHFVTPALDCGPVVIQAAVPVFPEDDVDTLAARVLEQEHLIYPQAVRWFLEDRLTLTEQGRVLLVDEIQASAALRVPSCP